MDKKILELLENRGGNYILPFFWQHGEDEAKLREYMGVINDCGIGAVCVESRPHPDYCGPKWWEDMDVIMDEARKRCMRVWVLDDRHFPTGSANGTAATAPDELCIQLVDCNTADVAGPLPSAQLNISDIVGPLPNPFQFMGGGMPGRAAPREFNDDKLISVTAARVVDKSIVAESLTDLTSMVIDGELVWDVPEGSWRIFVTYLTRKGAGYPNYINVISYPSCSLQINAVYEPHYEHYAADFGKTFAGFFSDEPLFGNSRAHGFDHSIGKGMPLPWSDEVEAPLSEKLGENWKTLLPALWIQADDSNETAKMRYAYMDVVTRLVEKDFSKQLGDWCEARGVEYIGHIIEDNNQHARLGQSFGHYFRGLNGQHMAGIDDIGGQVLVGGEDHFRAGGFGGNGDLVADGEFYHFALGKLGSSHGHIDPRKKGRTMCEIYGAYGWGTGVRTMKYLTDHFLVRGVNHYVPHAFTPRDFPDPDCPPHFYANGHNPQYRHFQRLMKYTNRVCHLINGGTHIAPAAILYHGEAEWTGDYMLLQKPARALSENQIDFDIIPADVFSEREHYGTEIGKTLKVNGESYKTLIVPYSQYITADFARSCAEMKAAGFEVIFLDGMPDGVCDGGALNIPGTVVSLDRLAKYLKDSEIPEISVSPEFRRLRYYHYQGESSIYMFSNEEPSVCFSGEITVPDKGAAFIYDAWENVCRPVISEAVARGTKLTLSIPAYQSVIVVFAAADGVELISAPTAYGSALQLDGNWSLSFADATEYPNFHDTEQIDGFTSVALKHPEFSGFMRYEREFEMSECSGAALEIGDAFEGAEVWINGKYAGLRIAPPFLFDISGLVTPGKNHIRIEIANTPERQVRAMPTDPTNIFSIILRRPTVLAPSGIVGSVLIFTGNA